MRFTGIKRFISIILILGFVLSGMYVDYNAIKSVESCNESAASSFSMVLNQDIVNDFSNQKILSSLQSFVDLDEAIRVSPKTSIKILPIVNPVDSMSIEIETSQAMVYDENNVEISCSTIIVNYIHQKDGKKC